VTEAEYMARRLAELGVAKERVFIGRPLARHD
jgi:hypothetical protein